MNINDKCPLCGSDWQGEPIPEDIKHHYAPPYFFRRVIGIDGGSMGIYDGIVAYQCPDCKEYIPRANTQLALELFDKFIEYKNQNTEEI